MIFTITTEIHACSLVNFYCQYADRHKFEIHVTRQRARAGNSTICYCKNNLMSVFNASVLLLTMNFVITLSNYTADPLGCRLVHPQLHSQCYDEIHDQ